MTESHRFPVDVLVVVEREGRILLTERAGGIYMAGHWAIPGGKVDAGEPVAHAAVRELTEELGVSIDAGRLQFLGVTHHRPPHGDSRVGFGFLLTDFDGEPRDMEPDKCARLTWFDPANLPPQTMPYTVEIVRLYRDKDIAATRTTDASRSPVRLRRPAGSSAGAVERNDGMGNTSRGRSAFSFGLAIVARHHFGAKTTEATAMPASAPKKK